MLKKSNIQWIVATILLMGGMAVLSSCSSDDDSKNSNSETPVVTPEEPTTDQLEVSVTTPLPAASLSQFAELSTGAALLKRLPRVTASIESDTEFVLLKGSDINGVSDQTMHEMARVLLADGYVALETPTKKQLNIFMDRITKGISTIVADTIDNYFDLTPAQMQATLSASLAGRMETRQTNLSNFTRGTDDDEVEAELMIFGCEDVFFQEPISQVAAATVYGTDDEGNLLTSEQTVTYDPSSMTAYRYGLYADGAAQWIIDTEKMKAERNQEASQSPLRRASGNEAINDIQGASESFTHQGNVAYTTEAGNVTFRPKTCQTILRSWGVHNTINRKDYYYVSESVLLCMGKGKDFDMFFSRKNGGTGYTGWTKNTISGKYDLIFGNFLYRYTTFMNLTGSGFIKGEAATPETANETVTESVNLTQASSSSLSGGGVLGFTAGYSLGKGATLTANYGTKIQKSSSTTNSFAMTNSKGVKGLSVVKNTAGTKVTWVYSGDVPKVSSENGNKVHEAPADILINDANLVNDICWSVENPSGHYKLTVESTPEVAVLLQSSSQAAGEVRIAKTRTETYEHELLMPSRYPQTWRMFLVVDEWDMQGYSQKLHTQLEDNIRSTYPDVYVDSFSLVESSEKSTLLITNIIQFATKTFDQHKDVLADLARSNGVKRFTIHWRCDNTKITSRNGYVVEVKD